MKIETKREEIGEIKEGDKIKEVAKEQVLTVEDVGFSQPYYNHLTPTEIEAFKMIELARIQNKYLTRENILLQEHITALKGIIRKLEHLLCSMYDTRHQQLHHHHPRRKRHKHMGMGTLLGS